MTYLVTGATGFIGRNLVHQLLKREGDVYVLVRPQSRPRMDEMIAGTPGAERRVRPIEGDITKPECGVSVDAREALKGAEVYHLAAVYDLEAPEEDNRRANLDGTRNVVELANAVGAARLHHVSSVAVAGGKWKGDFTEEMFDEGQELEHPYYATKFEAEKIVRSESQVPWRVYRPGIVIGSSETGEADRIDGPYYAFKILQRLRESLPSWVPLIGPEGWALNLVPVDFVARGIDHIGHQQGLDGRGFPIVHPHRPAASRAWKGLTSPVRRSITCPTAPPSPPPRRSGRWRAAASRCPHCAPTPGGSGTSGSATSIPNSPPRPTCARFSTRRWSLSPAPPRASAGPPPRRWPGADGERK